MNQEQIKAIAEAIKTQGVYITAVTNGEEMAEGETIFTDRSDAFIYTVGRKELNQPDVLILAGPAAGMDALTEEQVHANLQDGASIIINLVLHQQSTAVQPSMVLGGVSGKLFEVLDNPELTEWLKQNMTAASTYYNSTDYDVVVLTPLQIN